MKIPWQSILLCNFVFLISGNLSIVLSSPDIPLSRNIPESRSLPLADEFMKRVRAAPAIPLVEPADAVLVQTNEWQWHRYLKHTLNLPKWLDLGLEHRTRFETYDRPWRSSQALGRTDSQIQQRSRIRFGASTEHFKFLIEGQDSRVHLDDANDFVDTGIENQTDILQLVISATARNLFGTGLRTDLHFGRMTIDIGGRRFITRNAFRNTTNAFDGLHWQLTQSQTWRIRAFLVEPVLRDEKELDEQSQRSVFWGTSIESNLYTWLGLHAYYFGLNDQRSSSISAQRTFSTFGLRLHKKPGMQQFDYEIETVWQTGKRGNTNHFAHFQHITLGYTFDLPWSPRLLIYYDYASGDRNSNDSQDSAFDTLFGGRRSEYMPTGNFGPFFRTNVSSPGWRLIFVPAESWKLHVKHRIWYLATSRGAFAGSGLRDTSGRSGKFLGHDVELQAQWKVNQNVEFDAGYDHWFKGNYFDSLPASAGLPSGGEKDTDYFYISTTFRF